MRRRAQRIAPPPHLLHSLTTQHMVIYPMFALLQSHPTIGWLLLLQGTAGLFKAAYSGPMHALMSEIFPVLVRWTGLSIGHSIGVTIFGGFAPTIVETFIHLTGDKLAPS